MKEHIISNNYGLADAFFAIFGMHRVEEEDQMTIEEFPHTIIVEKAIVVHENEEYKRTQATRIYKDELWVLYQPPGIPCGPRPSNIWLSASGEQRTDLS